MVLGRDGSRRGRATNSVDRYRAGEDRVPKHALTCFATGSKEERHRRARRATQHRARSPCPFPRLGIRLQLQLEQSALVYAAQRDTNRAGLSGTRSDRHPGQLRRRRFSLARAPSRRASTLSSSTTRRATAATTICSECHRIRCLRPRPRQVSRPRVPVQRQSGNHLVRRQLADRVPQRHGEQLRADAQPRNVPRALTAPLTPDLWESIRRAPSFRAVVGGSGIAVTPL
jgi:hypothetical protein